MTFIVRVSALLLTLLALTAASAIGEIPEGYYESAIGKTGESLKNALHDIIDDHDELSYDTAYDALEVLDADPANSENVIGIYSRFRMDADEQYHDGDGWVREHVWPQSFGNFGRTAGAGTDLHHLRAADESTNNHRRNRSFASGGDEYIDRRGSHRGATQSKKGRGVWTWEPPDTVKGDVARMVLYMTTRYEGDAGELDLELVEEIQRQSDNEPRLGVLSAILSWHVSDPVDDSERIRNDLIFEEYQKNRNPFIDHPEFVELIWGSSPVEPVEEGVVPVAEISSTIEIGTYNLYWLGVANRYAQGLRTEEDVERIADFVTEDLDLEVIAFQEVNTSEDEMLDDDTEQSTQQYQWLKSHMEDDGYVFLEGSTGRSQRVVIAYDANEVTLLESARELEVSDWFRLGSRRSSNLRKPLAAKFQAGSFDFWLIAVHLKSQRGGDFSDYVRTQQTSELLGVIDDLIAEDGEQDIILAGDFNAEATDESIEALYWVGDFQTQAWPSRRTSNSNDASYLIGSFASLIDHIMVRPAVTQELVQRSTVVFNPTGTPNYTAKYSDHVPVFTSFSTEASID